VRRLSFKFLWAKDSEKKNFPSVSWKKIDVPKEMGGWGIKNIHCFAKSLAAKCVWRSLEGKGLWCKSLLCMFTEKEIG
jgi:hypothetical protein